MHITDDVERADLAAPVGPERRTRDFDSVDRLDRAQLVHIAEAFPVERADVALQIGCLLTDDMRAELPVRARLVPLPANVFVGIEYDGDAERVVFLGNPYQMRTVFLAHIGCIDHGQLAPLQADFGDGMHQGERVGGGVQAVLVIVDETAAIVRRDHLGRLEVSPREGRLPRAGRADQHDQTEIGDGDGAFVLHPRSPGRTSFALASIPASMPSAMEDGA
jgi:hypothetical protein